MESALGPPDLYLSLDVEADGPVPGRFSMLAFGLCVAGRFDGQRFNAIDPERRTFYRELRPVAPECDPDALRISDLDRERLRKDGVHPTEAMADAAAWIAASAGDDRPVICAFPAVFDWSFFWWYMVTYGPTDPPVGFSSCLDMKTMLAVRGKRTLSRSGKDDLPLELRPSRPHTHNALDDAIEQAELFGRLFTWSPAT